MPIWVSVIQAVSAPVIAFGALLIAWQQYHISKHKLKMDLYDRRYKIYSIVLRAMIDPFSSDFQMVLDGSVKELVDNVQEARFLFDAATFEYLNEVKNRVVRYRHGILTLRMPNFHGWAESQSFMEQHHSNEQWLIERTETLYKHFYQYLNIDERILLSFQSFKEMPYLQKLS